MLDKIAPGRRITAFFFAQSMSVGLANGFGGIWFSSLGYSTQQIGLLNALPIALLLVLTVPIGRLADKAPDWQNVIIIGAISSAALPVGLFFFSSFVTTLLFWTLAVAAQWVIVPVADAAALRFSRNNNHNFGTFRAFGTIGYLLTIFAAGFLFDKVGIHLFLPMFVGLCFLRAAASFTLPQLRTNSTPPATAAKFTEVFKKMKPWFLFPVAGWAILYSAHIVLNAFQALLWSQQGLSSGVIGALIGLGAIAETLMFFGFRHVAARISARMMIAFAAAIAVFRFAAMSFSPGIELLVGLQLLHSITYALGFLACTHFIAENTTDDIAAQAQGALVTLEQAVAIIALLVFGGLAGLWGASAYMALAGIAAIAGTLVLISIKFDAPIAGGS